ncbi:MAG: type III-B CRISPR module RAMP protein Cmr4 [bacterium]
MKSTLYIIKNQTNLHVGGGTVSHGIIDNYVQRDYEDFPCIHASSLKGAFLEYFTTCVKKENNSTQKIFGTEQQRAQYVFHDALLLSFPVRSNKKAYFHATCPYLISRLHEYCTLHNITLPFENLHSDTVCDKPVICSSSKVETENLSIEGYSDFDTKIISNIGQYKELIIFPDADFKMLIDDYNLPIIARNNLDFGESKNVFYEQIVPRYTEFYFFTSNYTKEYSENNDGFSSLFEDTIDEKNLQIGAHASIGYGVCQIRKFTDEK